MSAPEEPGEERGFLSGWSKRKLAAGRQNAPDAEVELPPETEAEPEIIDSATVQEEIDEQVLAELPSLEDIVDGSDIKPFLARGVPAKLRNAAMRRLWLAMPSVRDYADPAVDYAWDWNAPGGVPGGGGKLSEAGIAKMVKGLIGGQNEPSSEESDDDALAEAEDVGLIEGDTAEEHAVPDEDDASPSPVRLSDATSHPESLLLTEARPDAEIGDTKTSAQKFLQLRRHGGAVPE